LIQRSLEMKRKWYHSFPVQFARGAIISLIVISWSKIISGYSNKSIEEELFLHTSLVVFWLLIMILDEIKLTKE